MKWSLTYWTEQQVSHMIRPDRKWCHAPQTGPTCWRPVSLQWYSSSMRYLAPPPARTSVKCKPSLSFTVYSIASFLSCWIYSHHQSLVFMPDTRLMMMVLMRETLHFLMPSPCWLSEQHMDQTCLCSTIWWPLLWVRNLSRRWMRGEVPVIPLWSSGWCLNPALSFLSSSLGDFRAQHEDSHLLRLRCFGTDMPPPPPCSPPPKSTAMINSNELGPCLELPRNIT